MRDFNGGWECLSVWPAVSGTQPSVSPLTPRTTVSRTSSFKHSPCHLKLRQIFDYFLSVFDCKCIFKKLFSTGWNNATCTMSFEEKQSGRRDGRTTPFSFGIPVHGNRFVRPLQKHYRPIHYNEMSQRHRGPSWVCIVSRDRHTDKYVSTKTRTRTYSMPGRLLLFNKKSLLPSALR